MTIQQVADEAGVGKNAISQIILRPIEHLDEDPSVRTGARETGIAAARWAKTGAGQVPVRTTNEGDRPSLSIEMNLCSSISAWDHRAIYRTLRLFAFRAGLIARLGDREIHDLGVFAA